MVLFVKIIVLISLIRYTWMFQVVLSFRQLSSIQLGKHVDQQINQFSSANHSALKDEYLREHISFIVFLFSVFVAIMPKRPFLSIEDILGKNVTRNRPSDEQKMTTSLDSARRKELRCATDLSQSRNDLYHAKERRFTNSAIQQHLCNDFSDSRGHAYTINDLQPRLPTTLQLCSPSLDFCDMRERGYTSSQIQSHLIGKDQRCSICSPPCYRSPIATNRLNPTWIRYYSAFSKYLAICNFSSLPCSYVLYCFNIH